MIIQRWLPVLLCLMATGIQSQISLSGRVIDEVTGEPLAGVRVRTDFPDATVTTGDGSFKIRHVAYRDARLTLEFGGQFRSVERTLEQLTDQSLGDITFNATGTQSLDRELPSITLDEGEQDEGINVSSLLQSGNELFASQTNFALSPARFRRRGLESLYTEGYLNNLPVNDGESGGLFWSQWGGLNDVMRRNDQVIGAESSDWAFGGVAGTFNTDLRASSQWRQVRLSYALTNRSYRNRIMGTWSTGMLPSGWAFSFSGSRRWAQEGFIDGTFYDAWSYFASVDRKWSDRHLTNFVALGAPYRRGGASAAVAELHELAGSNYYNAYWGYQQGKKRNGRIYNGHQPIFMVRHDWKASDPFQLTAVVGYQAGSNSIETIDWLNAPDPRPDYYRRLPSYFDDPDVAAEIRAQFENNPDLLQIQWDDLYQVNYNSLETIRDVDGVEGNDVTGALSRYVIEDRRNDLRKVSGNVFMDYLLSSRSRLRAGVNAVVQENRQYKELVDLLGGDFYVDYDRFAEQDFPGNDDALQNDLLRPNRLVFEGDQFGWNYKAHVRQANAWLAYTLDLPKWEVGLSANLRHTVFWREGLTQNGRFPDNSLGNSDKNSFLAPGAKALLRYKLDGRNYLTVAGMYTEQAPSFRNAYLSPRTRSDVVSGLVNEKIRLLEARYDLRAPYLKISVGGYLMHVRDAVETTSFYHDDLLSFVNFSLSGIDRAYAGIEAAADYTIRPGLSIHGAAAIGRFRYDSRPLATITQDNDGSVLQEDVTVYARNYYVSGTPQEAYTAGLTYRSRKFWSLFLNVNYFGGSWLDFNPVRRTADAVDLVEPGSPQWDAILRQEQVDGAWTVDLSFYKSWMKDWPKGRTFYALNIGITNLLNNRDYVNGGYEQYRFDFETKDPTAFPTRYSYMQGLNYYLQVSVRL